MKKIIFIELNELNFDLVEQYFLKFPNKFNNLKKVSRELIYTNSENEYHLLEPWIQWVTVHTGLSAKEHNVFRLGDFINSNKKQYFEEIENLGFKVGMISSMNSINRLKNAAYFIPDPWTETKSDGSFSSELISKILKSTVNSNAQNKIGFKNYFLIIFILLKFLRFKNLGFYFKYFYRSLKHKWYRPLFLDLLLNDIHFNFLKKKDVNFSTIFFNAAAHIQHHYFFNSLANKNSFKNPEIKVKKNSDPFEECLNLYEKILEDYVGNDDFRIILATGLTQLPSKELEYYYRLNNHDLFFRNIGLKFKKIYPRMSRDFLVEFHNDKDRDEFFNKIFDLKLNKQIFFGTIDKRDKSLFISLTYDKEILRKDYLIFNNKEINIFKLVSFVSLKNGIHNQKGFLYFDDKIKNFLNIKENTVSLKLINSYVKKIFNEKSLHV